MRLISICILCTVFILLMSCGHQDPKAEKEQVSLTIETAVDVENETYEYGMRVDTFLIKEGTVKRNEFLSDILLDHNVDYSKIHELVASAEGVFDVRKIRAGRPYKIFCVKDSAVTVRCFVYENTPVEYIVFDLQDTSVAGYTKQIVTTIDTASGVIYSSLYQTLLENDMPPILAIILSEVFAWQVDFFRIMKGDEFKIIYEKKFVDDEFIKCGEVLAAYFKHNGRDFYAIQFEQDNGLDYFDEKGQGLRKAFLKAPLRFSRISSRYSGRRYHPILKRYKAHLGVDYAAPRGTPIHTVGDGVIVESGYTSGNGNYVKIRHNGTYTTGYLHLSRIKSGIRKGVRVKQKQVIGYVGSTGLATGPHLCFRFYKNGAQVNPLKIKIPPSEPVKNKYLSEYESTRDSIKSVLDAIILEQTAS